MPAHNFIDRAGTKVFMLTFIEPVKVSNRTYWRCRCDCGNESLVKHDWTSRKYPVKSCGCLNKATAHEKNYKHGHAADGHEGDGYHIWIGIKQRCSNPKHKQWADYEGRGVRVCRGILEDYRYFISIVGSRPKRMSIDRINNDGHYSCGKCEDCLSNGWPLNIRWATGREQSLNRRTTQRHLINGERLTPVEIQDKYGINLKVVWARAKAGLTGMSLVTGRGEDTLASRLKKNNPHNLAYVTVKARMRKGVTFEEAISVPVKHNKETSDENH